MTPLNLSAIRIGAHHRLFVRTRRVSCAAILGACCWSMPGCGTKTEPAPITQAVEVSHEPGVIEISKVDVSVSDDQTASFRIHYKFTSGKPSKFYMCNLTFPGSQKKGMKPLDAWEMKPDGNVLARLEIDDSVNEFSIQFSEADSPDKGYTPNSNVYAGKVFPDKALSATASPESTSVTNAAQPTETSSDKSPAKAESVPSEAPIEGTSEAPPKPNGN